MLRILWPRWCLGLLASMGLVLVIGCASSQSSRFYVLNTMGDATKVERAPGASPGISIGVGPVKLPDYLDRVQMVTRSSANTLHVAEFERWAEPLERGIPRILAENLSILLPNDNVVAFPWPNTTHPDYQVTIEFVQFDGILGQKAWLEFRWTILSEGGKQVRLKRSATLSEPAAEPSYEALVAAWNRALAGLSRDIATSIESVAQNQSK